jgi:hypothetical protein
MPLAERDTNIPPKTRTRTQTPPSHKTPQPHSRLPRFVATPNSAPAAIKWISHGVDPAASVAKANGAMRHTPTLRRDLTAVESSQKVSPPTLTLREQHLTRTDAQTRSASERQTVTAGEGTASSSFGASFHRPQSNQGQPLPHRRL